MSKTSLAAILMSSFVVAGEPVNEDVIDKEMFLIINSQSKLNPSCKELTVSIENAKTKDPRVEIKNIPPFDLISGAVFGIALSHKMENPGYFTSRVESVFPAVVERCHKNGEASLSESLRISLFKKDLNEVRALLESARSENETPKK